MPVQQTTQVAAAQPVSSMVTTAQPIQTVIAAQPQQSPAVPAQVVQTAPSPQMLVTADGSQYVKVSHQQPPQQVLQQQAQYAPTAAANPTYTVKGPQQHTQVVQQQRQNPPQPIYYDYDAELQALRDEGTTAEMLYQESSPPRDSGFVDEKEFSFFDKQEGDYDEIEDIQVQRRQRRS